MSPYFGHVTKHPIYGIMSLYVLFRGRILDNLIFLQTTMIPDTGCLVDFPQKSLKSNAERGGDLGGFVGSSCKRGGGFMRGVLVKRGS